MDPTQSPKLSPLLAQELEDGPLRRELGLGQKDKEPIVEPAYRSQLSFDGTGSEYFRIWIVNTLLTLLTLGVYSAWAKVRKARWFAQHTVFEGDRFDFHGQPLGILLGRAMALVLLVLWSLAFDWSLTAGLAMLGVLCVAGPLMFASAQSFKLANTSWRGLRFAFQVPRPHVYAVCVPLLLLWTASSVLEATGVSGGWFSAAGLTAALGFPWAHARLKQMQHEHASFGDMRFSFTPASPEFYGAYGAAVVLLMLVGLTGGIFSAMVVTRQQPNQTQLTLLLTAVMGLLAWCFVWPYFAARLQQVVWRHTRCGALEFRGEMRAAALWRLAIPRIALTVLTLGLYWPFAAVAIARYRVGCIVVLADQPVADLVAKVPVATGGARAHAAGDAAADFFGLDLGW